MDIQDNRLRFSSPRIDFENEVGLTGQDHDSYPAPQSQARYDHLRMMMIAFLAQQSSESPPTEFREGSPWFDLTTLCLKIRSNGAWVPYADVIALTEPDSDGNVVTLLDWYNTINDSITSLAPEVTFSGQCNADGVTSITIPPSVRSSLLSDSRVFLYVNGSLINPNWCSLIGNPPTSIQLSNISLSDSDTFVVTIRRISNSTFLSTTISIP